MHSASLPRNKLNFFAAISGMRADYAMATENRYRRQRTGVTATGGLSEPTKKEEE